jgi:hypothetical protein
MAFNKGPFSITGIPVGSSTGSSDAFDVKSFERKAVFISGTFSATIQVEISDDGSTWYAYGSPVSSTGTVVEVTAPCAAVRVNLTAHASGTVVATVMGLYSHEGG